MALQVEAAPACRTVEDWYRGGDLVVCGYAMEHIPFHIYLDAYQTFNRQCCGISHGEEELNAEVNDYISLTNLNCI